MVENIHITVIMIRIVMILMITIANSHPFVACLAVAGVAVGLLFGGTSCLTAAGVAFAGTSCLPATGVFFGECNAFRPKGCFLGGMQCLSAAGMFFGGSVPREAFEKPSMQDPVMPCSRRVQAMPRPFS